MNFQKVILLLTFLPTVSLEAFAQNVATLTITTTSSTEYKKSPATSIYPAFVDGLAYTSWTEKGDEPSYRLKCTGGSPPYQWKIITGRLPKGLEMQNDGQIKGTPVAEGDYTFKVTATDSKGMVATKTLQMTASPSRSRWFSDAKFGIMIQWGPFSDPPLQSKEDIARFESRISKFDAEKWAGVLQKLNAKVLNFTVKAGDGIRLWPSTTPSKYELKTKRNIVGELIKACHKRGIKFVAYIAPDHSWNKKMVDTGTDGSLGTLNKGLIKELVEMGVDGFWVDMGGTPELYPEVKPEWFPWKEIIPIIRTTNPYVIFANNPGLGNGGTMLRWPHTDVLVWEGRVDNGEHAFVTAKPHILKKDVAIEVDNLLDNGWAWSNTKTGKSPKSASMVIKNIKANWRAGATYMLNYPVPTDGEILPKVYEPILTEIGKFVGRNRASTVTPKSSLKKDSVYLKPQRVTLATTKNSKIYYTTDGTDPSLNSKLYKGPFVIDKTTLVKAVSINSEQVASAPLKQTYSIKSQQNAKSQQSGARLRTSLSQSPEKPMTDPNGYYRGMKITVGPSPILLNAIGRKHVQGNKNKHEIIIKKFADDSPVYASVLDTKAAQVQEDGFQYLQTPSITLAAGTSYIIGCQEDDVDGFLATSTPTSEGESAISISGPAILNAHGDRKTVNNDGLGAFLNLEYQPGGSPAGKSKNVALGAKATFLDNSFTIALRPVRNVMYPENAVDGDKETIATAGGKYNWTLQLDLRKTVKVSKAVVHFDKEAYSTHYELYASVDNKSWQKLSEKKDNVAIIGNITFSPTPARYIRIVSLKPDGPNQPGNTMAVKELEIFE